MNQFNDAPHREAPSRADVHEKPATPAQSHWGDISRQCLSDNSQWHAARGGKPGGDPTLDKNALASGVLQFGPVDHGTGKPGVAGDTNQSKGQSADKAHPSAQGPEAAAGKTVEGKSGEGKPGDAKASDFKPGDVKASDAKPGDAKPGDTKAGDDKASTLLSKDSTDEQKLAAVRDMAKAGITNVNYKDNAGTEHKLRLEVEGAGNKEMVHLFATGTDGREHTALRGISKADGSFEHERDRAGNSVDYKGKGYSNFAPDGAQTPVDARPPQAQGPDATVGARPVQSQQPDASTGARPVQSERPDTTVPAKPDQPIPPKDASDASKTPQAPERTAGTMDRSQFDNQLKDPRVMAAFAGRLQSEVGSQGHDAHVAFAEEVMNRAASRNQTLMQALSGSYYPTPHPGSSHNPAYVDAITTAWKGGTDTTHGATGNASGHVGFGVPGGHFDAQHQWVSPNQTANIGKERFGYEQVDLNKGWMQKYQNLRAGS